MQPYVISLGAGLLAGILYGLLGVRSPAPPAIALIGLLGILIGEQAVPLAKRLFEGRPVMAFLKTDCAEQVLGPHAVSRAPPNLES
jgi:XapX domain-containing protein